MAQTVDFGTIRPLERRLPSVCCISSDAEGFQVPGFRKSWRSSAGSMASASAPAKWKRETTGPR